MIDIKFSQDEAERGALENNFDVVILGGGPAGLAAGIYTCRALLKTLIVEEKVVGGEATSTEKIENYPGFPDGISGQELTERMKIQAENFGARILIAQVKSVSLSDEVKSVTTDSGTFTARCIIIATGSSPKQLNVPGESQFKGKGVSYCATCDAPFFAGQDIAIIGAGNSGIQEGLFLLKYVKSVTIIEFLPSMTAEKILQERIKRRDNVAFHLNSRLVSINGAQTVSSITVAHRETGTQEEISVSGVFIYAGLKPNTELLSDALALDAHGFIAVDEHLATNIPGVFAAGDVRKKILRQVVTAVADGALAAFSAQHHIDQHSS